MGKLDEVLTELWRWLITFAVGLAIRAIRRGFAAQREHYARAIRIERLLTKIAQRLGVHNSEESRIEDDTA